MKQFLIIISLFIMVNCSSNLVANADEQQNNGDWLVTKVIDGDTVKVRKYGNTIKVRLSKIDCPENGQKYYNEATEFLRNLIMGKKVKLVIVDVDRYGRLVADIYYNGVWINLKIVENGFAEHFINYSKNPKLFKILDDAESQAQSEKLNIWSQKDYESPSSYRKRMRAKKNKK